MKQIEMRLENFKLKEFVEKFQEFGRDTFDCEDSFIMRCEKESNWYLETDDKNRNIIKEFEKYNLFFPFSILVDEEEFVSADEIERLVENSSWDTIGYHIEIDNSILKINSAVYVPGMCQTRPPSIEIMDEIEFIDDAMNKFVEQFLIK